MCRLSRVPFISKCCCFISLRISAYLIGFLQSSFGLGILIYTLVNPSAERRSDGHDSNNTDDFQKGFYYIIGSVFILLGLILVLGVKIKNVLLIKMYIVLEIIVLFAGFIVYLIILISLFLTFVVATTSTSNFAEYLIKIFAIYTAQVLIVVIVISFAIIALKAYFLLCVYSYLKELIELETGTPRAVGYTAIAETDENAKV